MANMYRQKFVPVWDSLPSDTSGEAEKVEPTSARSIPPAPQSLGIRRILYALDEAFAPTSKRLAPGPDKPLAAPETAATPPAFPPTYLRRATKALVAITLAVAVGWKPLAAILSRTSAEAFVNARIITLRAPVDGEVTWMGDGIGIGSRASAAEPLIRIVEPRIDRARELDLERELDRAQMNERAIRQRLVSLTALSADLGGQTESFRVGRMSQLDERIRELDSQIVAAEAVRTESKSQLERYEQLAAKGIVRQALLQKAARDATVAGEAVAQLHHKRGSVNVELEAARDNRFVGDSFNDSPRSAQRSEELAQIIAEARQQLSTQVAHSHYLSTAVDQERKRTKLLSTAEITSPNNAAVWEIMTTHGERVSRGQELIRLVDCSSAIVSAAVDESVYDRVVVGDPATFRARGESVDRPGRVVRLTGMAAAGATLAISPSTMLKAPFRAAVLVPSLTQGSSCSLGRTGKVTFQKTSSSSEAAQARVSAP